MIISGFCIQITEEENNMNWGQQKWGEITVGQFWVNG